MTSRTNRPGVMARESSLDIFSKADIVTAIFTTPQNIYKVHVLATSLPGQGR